MQFPSTNHPDFKSLTKSCFLKTVDYRSEIPSTNDLAGQLAQDEQLKTPLLVICDKQTAGRGRGKNRWWSSVDNLAFSLVVDMPAAISPQLSLLISPLISLAICEALAGFHAADQFQIKWPNDVFVCERKIAGILIESSSRIAGRWVIGCGINVNHSATAPLSESDLLQHAISLIDLTGRESDRVELLRRILNSFEEKLELLAGNRQKELVGQIRDRCFLSGKTVTIAQADRKYSGHCLGINETGAMQIQTIHGIKSLFSGTVAAVAVD